MLEDQDLGYKVAPKSPFLLSLVPRLSPHKRGGGESLVTSAGEAVDFWHVIIYVMNVGCSHFSTNCHVI